MRRIILLAIALAIVVAVLSGHARGQARTAAGRIDGVAKDPSGAILPGVKVTLTGGNSAARESLTGADGRFVFDDVPPGTAYALRGELTGFRTDTETSITMAAGQTRTFELKLAVGCINECVCVTGISDLDELLTADAVVHVRVGDAGQDEQDGCGKTREAVVLGAIRFSQSGERIGRTFRLMGEQRFTRGRQYLLMVTSSGGTHPRVGASFEREVVRGRVRGNAPDVGIRNGMPIGNALTHLREDREFFSRYRRYDRAPPSTAGLDTLRYKTGWILAGMISNGSWSQASFVLEGSSSPPRELPRSNDRIRMTMDQTVYIPEFGARGEALRERGPTLRHLGVSDDTDTHVNFGLVYTVADVQLETLPGENRQFVWLRVVAP